MRIWRLIITRAPRGPIPRDALRGREIIVPGLYVCEQPRGCGWAFRYLGQGQWKGAYWLKTLDGEKTHDSRCEWSGYPRTMTTEQLRDDYADCFGRLVFLEPVLQRRWNGEPPPCTGPHVCRPGHAVRWCRRSCSLCMGTDVRPCEVDHEPAWKVWHHRLPRS